MIRMALPDRARRVRFRAGAMIAPVWILLFVPTSVPQATAREVFDPDDPAFEDGVSVPLPPAGMPPGATEYPFESNGVSFSFQSTSSQTLDAFGPGGILVWSFENPDEGVVVTVSPPVRAIGFVGQELDGCPGGTFVGAQGTEVIQKVVRPCDGFFGAADLGDMGTVNLAVPASIFLVDEMVFVPPDTIPSGEADVFVEKNTAVPLALNGVTVDFTVDVGNGGPDTAEGVRVVDFLPDGVYSDSLPSGVYDPDNELLTWNSGDYPAGGGTSLGVTITTPADRREFSCGFELLNVAVATGTTPDTQPGNNVSTAAVVFDDGAVAGSGEICGNGIDDDCDGRFDCADSECHCPPTLPTVPGGGDPTCIEGLIEGPTGEPMLITTCFPADNDADEHQCRVPRGRCGGRVVPAYCCDPATWSNPSNNGSQALQRCDLGVPGCAPVDPNVKASDPTVNIAGYGYTDAGRTMTYTIHYENVGNADALDVQILDVLDEDLDDTTLVVLDGGMYDSAKRTLVWPDPVLPPGSPRSVQFQVKVRADAAPGTRVRNYGTILFPNAVPPSRIDTEPVEHVVTDPDHPIRPDLRVLGCSASGPGAWQARLVNEGLGYAYNVTAAIIDPPASVDVVSGTASFAHMDDEFPDVLATVIPNATTKSRDEVSFMTQTPGDPCGALTWRIRWENLQGDVFSVDRQSAPDRDQDGVADADDNCPDTYNPDQSDSDQDGTGDACEVSSTIPCDLDGDGDVDGDDRDILRGAFRSCTGDDRFIAAADFDEDGCVTFNDYREWYRCYREYLAGLPL